MLVLAGLGAQARTVLEMDLNRQPVPLADWGDYLVDPTGRASAAQMARQPDERWRPTSQQARHRVDTPGALWIRLVVPATPETDRWYLELPDPHLDHVSLFTQEMHDGWSAQSAGDRLPVASWALPHRHPLLPVALSAEVPRYFMLRIEHATEIDTLPSFISESHLTHTERRISLLLGICFGLGGLACVMGLMGSASLRDRSFALFGLLAALLTLLQASLSGVGGVHLWPQAAALNDFMPWLLGTLTSAALLLFADHAMALRLRMPRLHRAALGLIAASLPVLVVLWWMPATFRFAALGPYATVSTGLAIASVLWARQRGYAQAGLWIAAVVPLGLAGLALLSRAAGLWPQTWSPVAIAPIAVALSLPVFLLELMLRSQPARSTAQRMRRLASTDPETGLMNEPRFLLQGASMFARSARLDLSCAMLVVDVVNIQLLSREFGGRSITDLPLRVAERLLLQAREIDHVSRVGGLRFGMLIEGPLTAKEAAELAQRIVARGLMPYPGKPERWHVQLRVAYAVVPHDGRDAVGVLERLNATLDRIKPDDRRAVFAQSSAPTILKPA